MKEITIKENEAGQRLDKYLRKYLSNAPSGFLYKMLRKKNITLNGKKADGGEILAPGDTVKFFMADGTIIQFQDAVNNVSDNLRQAYLANRSSFRVVLENEHIVIVDKPAGILTQKAKDSDISLNEILIGYLLVTNALTENELQTFRPSVCNRLDRNTCGLVICGKSLYGLQTMSKLIKERTLSKYYLCIVWGAMTEEAHLEGFLHKDVRTNKVTVTTAPQAEAAPIITNYKPLRTTNGKTLVEVELVTGKTHQIRSHLASIGYPIIGDFKYGGTAWEEKNQLLKKQTGIASQLLHAGRLEFPQMSGELADLSHKTVQTDIPEDFLTALKV